ncbi:MAG: vitamin K epoxide reductase family protein [Gemmatimonadetes bacterium]|nr:vitamin K epoxide reductase family protein [Gemmatimonadota bacterium]
MMWLRKAIAFLALGGLLISTYLLLHRLGVVGRLVCAVEGCEVVQTSPYAVFLSVPVAGWGVAGYALILVIAAAGAQPSLAESRGVAGSLAVLGGAGFAFSGYLTALEIFVINAICFWCVISYLLISAIFVLAALDLRRLARLGRRVATFSGT